MHLPEQDGHLHGFVGPDNLIEISVMKRPGWCDRGKWLVLASSTDQRRLCIDHDDAFPRYYFHDQCLVMETAHWVHLRLENLSRKEAKE